MARSTAAYAEMQQGPSQGTGNQIDWLDEGYYKIRAFARGPWIPCQVFLEDGERDPETWDLLSDQWLRAEWSPQTNSQQFYPIKVEYLFNRARRITKEEFKWLMKLKKLQTLNVRY